MNILNKTACTVCAAALLASANIPAFGAETVTLGDLTGEGKPTVSSIVKIASHLIGKEELTNLELIVADVDCSGEVNIKDLMLEVLYVGGKLDKFPKGEKLQVYTVTFETRVGTETESPCTIESQIIISGETSKKPADPNDFSVILQGWAVAYMFEGWYTDKEHVNSWDFSTPIISDTVVYARWNRMEMYTGIYKITFNTDGGTAMPQQEVDVIEGTDKVIRPPDPEKEGFAFIGWYHRKPLGVLDGGGYIEEEWDFERSIYELGDYTLYAKWEVQQ